MNKLRVVEAFSGIGSQKRGLENKNINHEVVATMEIDKYAIISYAAMHHNLIEHLDYENQNEEEEKTFLEKLGIPKIPRGKKKLHQLFVATKLSNNLGDISKVNPSDVPEHDLFTYSFPCQDISIAGKQKGFGEGSNTRSGLLWECEKIISSKKPNFLLLENVENLIGKRHIEDFDSWLNHLEEKGYNSYYGILNSKNVNIPQDRSRVFVFSVLKEMDNSKNNFFENLQGKTTDLKLKDIVLKQVEEKYIVKHKNVVSVCSNIDLKLKNTLQDDTIRLGGLFDSKENKRQAGGVYSINGLAPTCDTCQGGYRQILIPWANGLRKLTPTEYFVLMGFRAEDVKKCQEVGISDSQLYKQAGNSIVVNVLEELFNETFNNIYQDFFSETITVEVN